MSGKAHWKINSCAEQLNVEPEVYETTRWQDGIIQLAHLILNQVDFTSLIFYASIYFFPHLQLPVPLPTLTVLGESKSVIPEVLAITLVKLRSSAIKLPYVSVW